MKKHAAIVGLALLLVGIAYIRAIFSHQDRTAGIPDNVIGSLPDNLLDEYFIKEEASARLDSLRILYTDSLRQVRARVEASADSKQVADSLESLIDEISQKLASAEKSAERVREDKNVQFEKLIAGFYRVEMERLSADLSQYEREVSVEEIRTKALKYFGVSSEKLDRIIKKYR